MEARSSYRNYSRRRHDYLSLQGPHGRRTRINSPGAAAVAFCKHAPAAHEDVAIQGAEKEEARGTEKVAQEIETQ